MPEVVFRRKLISLTGYDGFVSQLTKGEVLVIEYETEKADDTSFNEIRSFKEFSKIYNMSGDDIYGFWAWDSNHWKSTKHSSYSVYPELGNPKYAIRRPIEDLVLSAVMRHIPAIRLLEGLGKQQWTPIDQTASMWAIQLPKQQLSA